MLLFASREIYSGVSHWRLDKSRVDGRTQNKITLVASNGREKRYIRLLARQCIDASSRSRERRCPWLDVPAQAGRNLRRLLTSACRSRSLFSLAFLIRRSSSSSSRLSLRVTFVISTFFVLAQNSILSDSHRARTREREREKERSSLMNCVRRACEQPTKRKYLCVCRMGCGSTKAVVESEKHVSTTSGTGTSDTLSF